MLGVSIILACSLVVGSHTFNEIACVTLIQGIMKLFVQKIAQCSLQNILFTPDKLVFRFVRRLCSLWIMNVLVVTMWWMLMGMS